MFQTACDRSAHQVHPVIGIVKPASGRLASAIGACILINKEGWFLTARHVFDGTHKMLQSHAMSVTIAQQREAIKADKSLSKRERQKQLRALPPVRKIEQSASVWGQRNAKLEEFITHPLCDLCLFRVSDLDVPEEYEIPAFRSDDIKPGEMLCRTGYALLKDKFVLSWDDKRGQFIATTPPILFVTEGLVSRFLDNGDCSIIEMSTPGLKGQSGGPIMDPSGSICGVQSATQPYDLEFEGVKVTQYYHVGHAVHVREVLRFLEGKGIDHKTSQRAR